MVNSTREEKDKPQEEVTPKHGIKDVFRGKKRPPRKLGRRLKDKRPHFKSFKSPGVK